MDHKSRIFRSRFIHEVKKADKWIRQKIRIISQSYHDEGATEITTKSPAVQRFKQILAISIAISHAGMTVFVRDESKAYVQSKSHLERQMYMRPPREMLLPNHTVLQVVKLLFGIPESGFHCYLT